MPVIFPGTPFPTTDDPNLTYVQSNATITASGSAYYSGYGSTEVSLFINVKASPTGTTPTIVYSIQEVDPGDQSTIIGYAVSSTTINSIGIQKISLEMVFGGNIKVSWTIGGTSTPTFTQVYSTLAAKNGSVKITDGTNGIVAVKPASTAAVAGDISIVTAPSPNTVGPVVLTSSAAWAVGMEAEVTPWGSVRVSTDPHAQFVDHFSSTLDAVQWNTPVVSGSGAAVVTSAGNLVVTAGTAASSYAVETSIPSFLSMGLGFTYWAAMITIEATAVTGQVKFWGVGSVPGTPTTAAPITNAVGYMQKTDGTLWAVIYSTGSIIWSQQLVRPTDGLPHRMALIYRPDLSTFWVDSIKVPVASTQGYSPAIDNLPILFLVVNGASPSAAGTLYAAALGVTDTAPDHSLADGNYQWIKAAVKRGSTSALITDPGLVVRGGVRPLYGTNNQSVTITVAGLANAAARASTVVDNTTTLYDDVLIFAIILSYGSGVSANGYVNIFGYATVDGGSNYSEGCTGSDAAITLVAPTNLVLIAQMNVVANGTTYKAGPYSFCRMMGFDRLPAKWGVVVQNQSGAAIGATATITYQGVNGQLL